LAEAGHEAERPSGVWCPDARLCERSRKDKDMKGLIRFLKRLRKRDDGSPVFEFAFVAPILVLMVIGTIEFGMIMFVNILMESGLRDAARYGITGNQVAGMTRMERIIQIVSDRTMGLVDMAQAKVQVLVYPGFGDIGSSEPFVDGNGNGTYDKGETFTDTNANGVWDADIGRAGPGGSGDVVLYRMTYDWPLLTPLAATVIGHNGKFTINASIAVRNEPWNQANAS